ncbi:MAG: hypothetical protein ACI86L_001665 [Dokdonia sp.]|jgi:hypothetical protein
MKRLHLLPLLAFVILVTSCSTVKVASDYDQSVNFDDYKTYAFYKPGIDKADISDLDKRRILRAIDAEMSAKGFMKSESPAVLVSIFTKAKERIDVYQNNWGVGNFWGAWGGGPWGWGGNAAFGNTVSRTTSGTLYIDLIDTSKKQLIWQGQGTAPLVKGNIEKREARIQEIVREIMMVYPPNVASN